MEKVQNNEENRKDGSQSVSLESLYAYLRESSEQAQKRFELENAEWDRRFEQEKADRDRRFEQEKAEWNRRMEETDRQMKKTDEKMREVSRQLGDMGNSHGDVAEEYFQNAFKKNPALNGEIFDKIDFNVKPLSQNGQVSNEYDIIMINEKSVAIIEIKYHFELRKNKLEEKLKETLHKLEAFKAFYPKYKNHDFYQGIASLSFDKSVEKIIQEAGIAIIKQVGDKMVINSENLKVF